MTDPLTTEKSALAPSLSAPQHKPRPLTLFLEMLRGETAGDAARMARALMGLRAYQEAHRTPGPALMPAIGEKHGAVLRDYGGNGRPLLFIPSLINPPNILDLDEERSLLRWLAARGHRVLLLDWGSDAARRRDMSIGDHVENVVVPLVQELEEAPALVGYCLGGTMAVAAARLTAAPCVATIAAPWHFDGYPPPARAALGALWASAEPIVASLGLLPVEILQSAFWSLDPARTIAKFEAFAATDAGSPEARAFVALEDWANDGPALSGAAARELFEDFFARNLTGSSGWRVGGHAIDPTALPCPLLNIVSTSDRIVPAASAIRAGERIELAPGHVGMMVGGEAKAMLWEPLDAWLSRTGAS